MQESPTRATAHAAPGEKPGRECSRDVAVIGMAGRFPGARNVDEFWANLLAGKVSIARVAADKSIPASSDRGSHWVNAEGILADYDSFDESFFHVSPHDARVLDPQHRLFLECAVHALEDAACDVSQSKVGVYAGQGLTSYLLHNVLPHRPGARLSTSDLISNDKDFLATHVAHKLNLRGPCASIQTACSSSLVAVAMAVQDLLAFRCDVALAGGVFVKVPHGVGYEHVLGGIMSADGHCRAFDADARGTVPGSGVGIVVLKRREDAVAADDRVDALIIGSAINNDGALKVGFTAPGVKGQTEVILMARGEAGIDPATIEYIETHGTGTPLGDQIEIAALRDAFLAGSPRKHRCWLGSVKANVGHLDAAAGIAGLIKTVLAVKNGVVPPAVSVRQNRSDLEGPGVTFGLPSMPVEWPHASPGEPRRAAVSSFGLGGTNAHLIVESAPERRAVPPADGPWLVMLSAHSRPALTAMARDLASHLERHPDLELADGASTLARRRADHAHRLAFVVSGRKDAIRWLEQPDVGRVEPAAKNVVLLFPGEGSPYDGMGRGLYARYAQFRRAVDDVSRAVGRQLEFDIRAFFAASDDTRRAPPLAAGLVPMALFVVEYALARLLMEQGLEPTAVVGHGIGEVAAACCAGAIDLDSAVSILGERTAPPIESREPRIAFYSSSTGRWVHGPESLRPDHWARHIVAPVRFGAALDELAREPGLCLEVGPGAVLSAMGTAERRNGLRFVACLDGTGGVHGEVERFLQAQARLWAAGAVFVPTQPDQSSRPPVRLPSYPFQRSRHWLDPPRPPRAEAEHAPTRKGESGPPLTIPSWKLLSPLPPSFPTGGGGAHRWVLFSAGDVGEAFARVLASLVPDLIIVRPGAEFARRADRDYVIRAHEREDHLRIVAELARMDGRPLRFLHAWQLAPAADADFTEPLECGLVSLVYLLQGIGHLEPYGRCEVDLLASGLYRVMDEDQVLPARAAMLGCCRAAPQEYVGLTLRVVDASLSSLRDGDQRRRDMLDLVTSNLIAADTTEVALRGRQRWGPGEPQPLVLASTPQRSIREDGVYVVTGGGGAMGSAMASYFAARARVRVVLIGRSLGANMAPEEKRSSPSRVAAIEEALVPGGSVHVVPVDVADRDQLDLALREVRRRFGRIVGVVHAAGVAGGRTLQAESRESLLEPLRAKLWGTAHLLDLTAADGLDFFFLCSSTKAGQPGPGEAAYGAANCALTAFAHRSGRPEVCAIHWGFWPELGLAAATKSPLEAAQFERDVKEHSLEKWGIGTFDRIFQGSIVSEVIFDPELPAPSPPLPGDEADGAPMNEPAAPRPSLDTPYAPPSTSLEEKIAAIWRRTFALDRVGVTDNFYELGGDSLIKLRLAAELRSQSIVLSQQHLAEAENIQQMAAFAARSAESPSHPATGCADESDDYPLTPTQRWFFEQNLAHPNHWNQSVLLEIAAHVEVGVLREACSALVARHEALRLRFRSERGEWRQEKATAAWDAGFEVVDLGRVLGPERRTVLERRSAEAEASLDLHSRLVRFVYFHIGAGQSGRLLIAIHHVAVDVVSWTVLLRELGELCQRLARREKVELETPSCPFTRWASQLEAFASGPEFEKEQTYWRSTLDATFQPLGPSSPMVDTEGSAAIAEASIDEDLSSRLAGGAAGRHGRLRDTLLTGAALALSRWMEMSEVAFDIEGLGRTDPLGMLDLSGTVGWCTSIFPVRLQLAQKERPADFLARVGQMLRSVPSDGIGYGLARYRRSLDRAGLVLPAIGAPSLATRLRRPPISFLYLGADDASPDGVVLRRSSAPGPERHPENLRPYQLDIVARLVEGRVSCAFVHSRHRYDRTAIGQLLSLFQESLHRLAPPQ